MGKITLLTLSSIDTGVRRFISPLYTRTKQHAYTGPILWKRFKLQGQTLWIVFQMAKFLSTHEKKQIMYLQFLSGHFYCFCQGSCHGLPFWSGYFLFYSVVLSPCVPFHFLLLPFVCFSPFSSVYTCVSLVNHPLWVFPSVFVGLSVSVLCLLSRLPILFSCILLPDSSCHSGSYFVFVFFCFCTTSVLLTHFCLSFVAPRILRIFGLQFSLKLLLVFNLPGFQMSAFGSLCVKPDRG